MNERNMREWLDTAVAGIRFGPDRRAVEAELRGHFEDKTADLERMYHLNRREAEEMALKQMGDAEEIGREMAKIHTPWLGYLWRTSQVLLAVVLLLFALGLKGQMENNWLGGVRMDWESAQKYRVAERVLYEDEPAASMAGIGCVWDGATRLALYPQLNQEQRLGEATVTLHRAALWQKAEGRALYAQMQINYDKPWEKSMLLERYLQAEDSLGNHYGYELTIRENGASLRGMGSLGTQPHWDGYSWNFFLDDLPEEAQWVRFCYGLRPDSKFSFVIDLSGEVQS